MKRKAIITRTCEISLDKFGILHVKILNGVVIDKEDAIDNFLVVRNLTRGRPVLKLIDARNKFEILQEAKEIVENENNTEKHITKAIIVSSEVEKKLRNFFLSLVNARFPVKIFTSEQKAIDWLRTFIL
jgi:hypothetical protein